MNEPTLHSLDCRIVKEYLSGRIILPKDAPQCSCGAVPPINLNDVVIPGDTWTSGKILPTPENDRQIADYFLAVCSDRENVTIEWFWFDANEWRDENDNPITISAWRRIPMDGIDEAVRLGDLA